MSGYSRPPNDAGQFANGVNSRVMSRHCATLELVRRIEAFVAAYNATARPFAWTATPEAILAKLERLLHAIRAPSRGRSYRSYRPASST
ncbi:hypothetical protein tb265_48820 [Gemmatimonadetes bacterium T265]|nr:hypothetical protein tb265_48820 [Gemmatimonadetes bacterium T265]